MSEGICHCGHERYQHAAAYCAMARHTDDGGGDEFVWHGRLGRWMTRCPCPGYDDSVLPIDGERLEFGKHRQPAPEAETAPAWPSLGKP